MRPRCYEIRFSPSACRSTSTSLPSPDETIRSAPELSSYWLHEISHPPANTTLPSHLAFETLRQPRRRFFPRARALTSLPQQASLVQKQRWRQQSKQALQASRLSGFVSSSSQNES